MENKEKEALLDILVMMTLLTVGFQIAAYHSAFLAGITLLLGLITYDSVKRKTRMFEIPSNKVSS